MKHILVVCLLLTVACSGSGGSDDDGGADAGPIDTSGGFVTYMTEEAIFRIPALPDSSPINITRKLESLGAGTDNYPAVSKNGEFMTVQSERFEAECEGWHCVAIVNADFTSAETVRVGDELLRPEGRTAISNDGNTLVYASGESRNDLFAITREGQGWSAPVLLTSSSPHDFNDQPVLSEDGTKVLFDCGPVPYGQAGTGVCEVSIDGSGFAQLVDPDADNPSGGGTEFQARHADYTSDGGIIFEADWESETLWYRSSDSATLRRVVPDLSNDNTPCVLPGDRVASLWLGRPDTAGLHELKLASADGLENDVLTPDVDVADIGMSCHR